MTASKLPAPTDQTPTQYHDPVQMAAAAFLARYKTNSRRTYAVALRCYLNWCRLNGLDPLAAQRPHIELFSRIEERYCEIAAERLAQGALDFGVVS